MFEKEAKEYSEKDLGDKYLSSVVAKDKVHAYKLGQYDGFVSGAEFAYNKANEWHNIKENPNDLPNDEELVVADNGLAIDCVKFIKNEFGNSWRHDKFELYNVIYWKKLVLSKDRNK